MTENTMPAGACDTHLHLYDHRYPIAPTTVLRPHDAGVDDYRLVQRELGLQRLVLVQPTTYGLDNSLQIEAGAAFGDESLCGPPVVRRIRQALQHPV